MREMAREENRGVDRVIILPASAVTVKYPGLMRDSASGLELVFAMLIECSGGRGAMFGTQVCTSCWIDV